MPNNIKKQFTDVTVFDEIIGKSFTSIEINKESDVIIFTTTDNEKYKMYHPDTASDVEIGLVDICGNITDILVFPILRAERTSMYIEYGVIKLCIFFHLATHAGLVTIKWLESSSCDYAEEVEFIKMKDENHGSSKALSDGEREILEHMIGFKK